ncbi:ESX-2 secretion-associated protein EspG2 [Mycolicibacterium insubricum]|uniref:ESX secretion-associated protein EspG n=1 Tax=Mycolicibacterium insubricum TaxID=444597 RepID=A0A1X0DJI4_9MYCO|nr:ESX secretion-associated protein EspG [Mycolicibacterium insubricum]MCB9441466.1 ESX secretion-associated protein EspG [Mycolicibacterium sp.]ORA71990.1 ESX secretion-associated protein EspG [Mycolicibacterium insubricum]BBZ67552.1 ESX-2 secretion-associated protein EspG2 [Mycolicibacterium insubricum]
MLTTTIDGLWVLQVLTGIEVLGPELGLRPHLPRAETRESALGLPIAEELRRCGLIDDAGRVDPPVAEWLTVAERRDIALVVNVVTPAPGPPARVLLARFAQWWVVLERCDDLVRIGPAGTSTTLLGATALIGEQIDRLCGRAEPAPLKPVTLPAEAVAGVRDTTAMRALLRSQGLDGEQIRLLSLAGDPEKSAQAGVVAVQSGVDGGARAVVEAGAVTVLDTPEGRIVAEVVVRAGRRWLIAGPGTSRAIMAAVGAMLGRLPAESDWYSYRKVV